MKMKLVKVLGVTLAVSCMLPMAAFAAESSETEVVVIEAEEELEDIATPEEAEAELEMIEDEEIEMAEEDIVEAADDTVEPAEFDMASIFAEVGNNFTNEIIGLTDQQIEDLKKSKDESVLNLVNTWEANRGDLGALVEVGTAEVIEKDEVYTVTVPVQFDTYDADFIYTLTQDVIMSGALPQSFVINVNYPFSVLMKQAAMNTIMGIGTVFVMLVFLSGVIALMGAVCKSISGAGKKKEAEAPKAAPAPAPVVVEEETDDEEIIAVIAAAIAAAEGTSPDGFVVRSVRKVNRRKW